MSDRAQALLAFVLGIAAPGVQAGQGAAATSVASCDHACLLGIMDGFLKAMAGGEPGSVRLGAQAEIRENARVVPLESTAWKGVKAVRSVLTFADSLTGNVVARAGVELADGKPGYISTRLKVGRGGNITDVELSSDTSARVLGAYVWKLDPEFGAVLRPEQRMSRSTLEALGRRYFHSLSTHIAVAADFDERCDRFHSGQKITNVAGNTVEAGPPRSCASSLEGTPPWGPATEQRFPVIDPERGIVFGVTLLHFPELSDQSRMYVSEIFKVVGGRIVKIDNIGLMLRGVETLGFVH